MFLLWICSLCGMILGPENAGWTLTKLVLTLALIKGTVTCALYLYCKWKFRYWPRRKVPMLKPVVPWGHNTVFLTRQSNFGELMAQYYAEMKSQGHRYAGFYLFTRPTLILIDPDLIKYVLSQNFPNFPDRNIFFNERHDPISGHLLSVNGDKWRLMRAKMTPQFSSAKIKMMFRMLTSCAQILENRVQKHCQTDEPVEVKSLFAHFMIDFIALCVFGLDLNLLDSTKFRQYAEDALSFGKWRSMAANFGSAYPDFCRLMGFRQISKHIGNFFISTVKKTVELRQKTDTQRKDFMQLLINMKKNESEGLSVEEIAAQCFIFILAGFETSSKTSAHALFEIARDQKIQERVKEEIRTVLTKYDQDISYEAINEMKYLDQVVHETLRMYTPIYFVGRVCTSDCKLPETDLVVEKGTWVLSSLRGLHLDPDNFPDPHKFDPDRFTEENRKLIRPFTFLPFGDGPRNCIGYRLGLLQVKVSLVNALRQHTFSVSPKTSWPFKLNKDSFLFEVVDDIFLDCHRDEDGLK